MNTTSDAPKSLPLVHHLPSIEALAPLFDPVLVLDGVLAGPFAGVFVGLPVVVFAGAFGASEDLPPAGCAHAGAKANSVKVVIANSRKDERRLQGSLIRCGLYQLIIRAPMELDNLQGTSPTVRDGSEAHD